MANFFTDNEDLKFYLDKGIDWGPIVKATERGDTSEEAPESLEEAVSLYKDILELVGKFSAEEVAPHVRALDKGVKLVDGEAVFPPEAEQIYAQMRDLELMRMSMPRELGGMNCPVTINYITMELLGRADTSVTGHFGFHTGVAMTLLMLSIREGSTTFNGAKIGQTRFQAAIEAISSGEAWGSMDITEPNAGSDMAALRTTARLDDQGVWRINGEKIWITSGHGKYHIVVARTEDPTTKPGLAGLSLFLVPAFEEDESGNRKRYIQITRLEEKLGHHGSATCQLLFEDAPGELLGQRGEGFKHMLLLMNMARVSVGFECIGMCEAGYRAAKDYAAERPSMGKTIDRHEMIADMLDEMQTDIQGLRALAMYGATQEELGQRLKIFADYDRESSESRVKKLDKKARRHAREARRVTPLLKYLASEKAVEISRRAIQIHGGNGYTTEFGVEKLLRDALIMPIWEGTSQIQSLMAMKDTFGDLMKNPQKFVRSIASAKWRALSARHPLERRVARLQGWCYDAEQFLLRKTAAEKLRSAVDRPISEWVTALRSAWDPKRDFRFAMLHAERLTRMQADVAIVEVLLAQAQRFPERAELLERYLDRAEPRCRFLKDQITTTGERLLERLAVVDDPAQAAE